MTDLLTEKDISDFVDKVLELPEEKQNEFVFNLTQKYGVNNRIKTWFIHNQPEKTKYCPHCGSNKIKMPNDLWEWVCTKCGCHWGY